MRKRHLMAVVTLTCLAALTAGCAARADGPVTPAAEGVAQTFVGAVQGSETYVALQLGTDGSAQAYLCDSSSVAQVLRGEPAPDGTVALAGDSDTGLSGRVDGDTASGTVTTAGVERPFSPVRVPGTAATSCWRSSSRRGW